MIDTSTVSSTQSAAARRLAAALEPVIGQVYFSREAHAGYVGLGFDPSPGDLNGVALPDGPAYFTSRGSVMGQVSPHIVAAAFAVFSPAAVCPSVALGWQRTDAATICAARDAGAIGQLERIIGATPEGIEFVSAALARGVEPLRPEGRPLFAGLLDCAIPDHPLGALWRAGDRLREYRGDGHTAAWVAAGFDATEIGLVTELYWGLPMRTYSRTRAWTDSEFDAAEERLRSRGLLDGAGLSSTGRERREAVEVATDALMAPALAAIGDDLDAVCTILERWGADVRAASGYPDSGPHELAERAARI